MTSLVYPTGRGEDAYGKKGKKDQGNGLAGRKPMTALRSDGKLLKRRAERQRDALKSKRPPRMTRSPEPEIASGSGPAAAAVA